MHRHVLHQPGVTARLFCSMELTSRMTGGIGKSDPHLKGGYAIINQRKRQGAAGKTSRLRTKGRQEKVGMAEQERLKYMIIGAGGTGGAVGSHLARAGYDVTFIARGKHLEAMRKNGLKVLKPDGDFTVDPVQAFTSDEFQEMIRSGACSDEALETGSADIRPDVIFVCLKGYSIDGMIPFLAGAAGPDTVIIPILNIFGTGGKMQEKLPDVTVTDGCIYVASEVSEPGVILMKGGILRVVFGLRREQKTAGNAKLMAVLGKVRDDLCDAGIEGILSDNIERDAMRKFSYVSPQGACGLYYDVPVGAVQKPGEVRECFASLVQEISDIADAMGIGFGEDVVSINLEITEGLAPDMTTSLQRDIARGGASEIDGLIYEVPRLAARYGVSVPVYEKIAAALRERGL